MSEFTPDEIEGIVKAMSQKPPSKEEATKIPLLPPGSYGKISHLEFSPLEGEKSRPLSELTEKEISEFQNIRAQIEVVFGKKKLTLKELAALKKGSLLPFDELCDALVDIYINGIKIARGEIVAVDGHYGVRIISFIKKTSE